MQDNSEALAGGGIGGAERAGDVVRRPAGPWTPTVHALLDHLNRAGLDHLPRAIGYDDQGRELLSYIDGDTVYSTDDNGGDYPEWAYSDELLEQTIAWLARYHEVVRDFRPEHPHWRTGARRVGYDEIVCHNDVRPANVIVTGPATARPPTLVGVVDWDMAGPGRPINDLVVAAWSWVPLWKHDTLPDTELARRLRLLAAAYGRYTPLEVLCAVPGYFESSLDLMRGMAANGDAAVQRLLDAKFVDGIGEVVVRFRERLPRLAAALEAG